MLVVGNTIGTQVPRLSVVMVNPAIVFQLPVTNFGKYPVVGVTAKLKFEQDGALRVQVDEQAPVELLAIP